jgi:hypothetical protein
VSRGGKDRRGRAVIFHSDFLFFGCTAYNIECVWHTYSTQNWGIISLLFFLEG